MSSKKNNNKPLLGSNDLVTLVKASPAGVIRRHYLHHQWQDASDAIREARGRGLIGTYNDLVFDLARLDKQTASEAIVSVDQNAGSGLPDFAEWVSKLLKDAPQPMLPETDIKDQIGDYFELDMLDADDLGQFGVKTLTLKHYHPYHVWAYLDTMADEDAHAQAEEAAHRRYNEAWQAILEWAGDELRMGVAEGHTVHTKAMARLYTRSQAEAILQLPKRVFRLLMAKDYLPRIALPDGGVRFRVQDVHRLKNDKQLLQEVEGDIEVNSWQLRTLTDLKLSYLKTMLHNAGVRPLHTEGKADRENATVWYRWSDVRRVFWPEGDYPTIADLELIEESEGVGRQAWWSEKIHEIHHDIEEKRRQQREAKDRRRQQFREQRETLRAKMLDNFPSWLRDPDLEQTAYIHVGPTNSGKTHDSLVELANAGSGWYLAPLRLLAREMFERLNQMGVYCSLLTGEERIDIPGSTITAATVEMFNPAHSGQCVVIDEAHMVADDQRGWAWTQALVNAQAPQLRVITAPHGLNLLTRIFESTGVETQVLQHHRLVPLEVAPEAWSLRKLPARSLLIAFTRRDVLRLKYTLQQMGRSVAVVYGALPPEVRLKQARRFFEQEVEICVATDAVGMGLNLPADNVVFSTLTKFDGRQQRRLDASELQQIAGRAGRYGFAELGLVGGIDKYILDTVRKLLNQPIPDVQVARLAPRTDEIELLEGDLAQRLILWQQLNAIPNELRDILTSTDMAERIELAQLFSYQDMKKLGVEKALLLVNAPVRNESQDYWVECATAVLNNMPLPLPPESPARISEGMSLKRAEMVIACIDIYLWLSYRQPFQHLVDDPNPVIHQREALTREMDLALMRKFNPNTSGFRGADPWFEDGV